MGDYAELYFAEKEEDIPINKHVMKLPSKVKNKIIKWKLALKYDEQTTWQVKGDRVQMPMTYTMYRLMPLTMRRELFKKMEKKLEQRGITHVILPKLMSTSPFQNIEECTGNDIKPFFIMDIIHFITKEKIVDKALQHIEVIILDGNQKIVDTLINLIYPHINHLTVVTNTPERFQKKTEAIFEDVGLNIQVLSYTKGGISQGDIIIDPNYDDLSVIHFCKPNAIYLDIGNHAEKTTMLLERQSKVAVIDEFLLAKEGEIVNTTKAELLLTMKKVFSRDYEETMKRLKKQNIMIYKLVKQG